MNPEVKSIVYPFKAEQNDSGSYSAIPPDGALFLEIEGYPSACLERAHCIVKEILSNQGKPWHFTRLRLESPIDRALGEKSDSKWLLTAWADFKRPWTNEVSPPLSPQAILFDTRRNHTLGFIASCGHKIRSHFDYLRLSGGNLTACCPGCLHRVVRESQGISNG